MFISGRSWAAMNLRRLELNFVRINYRTIKFPVMGIFLTMLTVLTCDTAGLTRYQVYPVFAALQEDDKDYEIDSLFIALLTNGDASIDYNLVVNTNKSSAKVALFGETVHNLTLTDYNATNITYQPTGQPNEITIFSKDSPDIHVAYTTSDLVDKQNRNWTFSFSFPDKFLLKMPSQAHIVSMEPPAFLTPTDERNLWGFGPGQVQVSYIIGPLGTREEAQASIRSVEDALKETKRNHVGIVVGNVTTLLEESKLVLKQGKYLEAVSFTANALNLLENTTRNYESAHNAISQAQDSIINRRNNGYDTPDADKTLSEAQYLINIGDYMKAEKVAMQVTSQSNQKTDSSIGSINYGWFIISGLPIALSALVIFFVVRKKRSYRGRTTEKESSQVQSDFQFNSPHNKSDAKNNSNNATSYLTKTKVQDSSPLRLNVSPDSPIEGVEIKDYLQRVVEEVGNARNNHNQQEKTDLNLSNSVNESVNKELLEKIVYQIKVKKPYLRGEDRNLLDYLCEKEGTAFESEIRNKFILPRTSLWRLIKRLEREELVEVRKVGGQNLIKLKFEDKTT